MHWSSPHKYFGIKLPKKLILTHKLTWRFPLATKVPISVFTRVCSCLLWSHVLGLLPGSTFLLPKVCHSGPPYIMSLIRKIPITSAAGTTFATSPVVNKDLAFNWFLWVRFIREMCISHSADQLAQFYPLPGETFPLYLGEGSITQGMHMCWSLWSLALNLVPGFHFMKS